MAENCAEQLVTKHMRQASTVFFLSLGESLFSTVAIRKVIPELDTDIQRERGIRFLIPRAGVISVLPIRGKHEQNRYSFTSLQRNFLNLIRSAIRKYFTSLHLIGLAY